MAKLIYADPDDEITNLVDRLRAEKAETDLVFVLPAASRVMQSGLNARLLMQYSNSLGKQTAVVSPDPRTQGTAIETGFTVYPTMTDYEAGRSIDRAVEPGTPLAPNFEDYPAMDEGPPPAVTPRRTEDPAAVAAPRARPAATRTKAAGEKKASKLPWILGGVGVVLLLLILLFFVVPSATVTILTAARSVSATPTVTGSTTPTSASASAGASPAAGQLTVQTTVQQAQETTSQSRAATGKKDVPAVASSGAIVFTYSHEYCNPICGNTAFLPRSSEVSTDDGKKFLTTADSNTISVGQSTQAIPIQARQGGAAGNVGAGAVKNLTNNPDANSFQITNASPTGNGADATTKQVVSQTDLDTAKRDLGDALTQKVKDDLKQKAGGQTIIAETQSTTVDANYDHKAGDEAANFNANITAKGQATSFDENQIKQVLTDALKRQAPSGYTLTADAPKLDYKVAQKDTNGGVVWDATASGFMAVAVDQNSLKKNITGQSPAKARSFVLGHVDANDVVIKETPSFIPWLPFIGGRIDIREQVQNNTPQ